MWRAKTYEKDKLKDFGERVELIAESGFKTVAIKVIACNFVRFIKAQPVE